MTLFRRRPSESPITRADRARDAGEWVDAARYYRMALERKPDQPAIWVQYGHALKESGKLHHAEAAYRRAIAHDSKLADARLQLGHLHKVMGRRDDAIALFAQALAIDPRLVAARDELRALGGGAVDTDLQNVPVGADGAEKAKGRKASTISLADEARDSALWGRAARLYRAALERNPARPSIWVQYGHVLKEDGQLAEAERAYRRAIALAPSSADAHYEHGGLLASQEDIPGAQAAYLRAFALDPSQTAALDGLAAIGWSSQALAYVSGVARNQLPELVRDPVHPRHGLGSTWDELPTQPEALRRIIQIQAAEIDRLTLRRDTLHHSLQDPSPAQPAPATRSDFDAPVNGSDDVEVLRAIIVAQRWDIHGLTNQCEALLLPSNLNYDLGALAQATLGTDNAQVFAGDRASADGMAIHVDRHSTNSYGLLIEGWAAAGSGVIAIELSLNGHDVQAAHYGIIREDVGREYPQWPGSLYSGFLAHLAWRVVGAGRNIVTITARCRDGRTTSTEVRFGSVDSPDNENVLLSSHIDLYKWQKEINLASESSTPLLMRPIGVFLHIYYPELLDELIRSVNNIPFPKCIYASTDDESKREEIQIKLNELTDCDQVEVIVTPNLGYDIGPFCVSMVDRLQAHDVCLKLHTKRSLNALEGVGNRWRKHLYHQLASDNGRVRSIVGAMLADPELGILIPEYFARPTVGPNRLGVRQILDKLKFENVVADAIECPSGSMFWFRSAALASLVELKLNWDDFGTDADARDGTLAHAIERCFFFLCAASGKKWGFIPGVPVCDVKGSVEDSIELIRSHGVFDAEYYTAQIPDVPSANFDPLVHYVSEGARRGFSPHVLFDPEFYSRQRNRWMDRSPDPLSDFLRFGHQEQTSPHRLFDSVFYQQKYTDVRDAGVNPWLHYLEFGGSAQERRDTHPLFSGDYYSRQLKGRALNGSTLLADFMNGRHGAPISPHPLFDINFYLERSRGLNTPVTENPLLGYLNTPGGDGAPPHLLFDEEYYLEQWPELAHQPIALLEHYCRVGYIDKLSPHRLVDSEFLHRQRPEFIREGIVPLQHYVEWGLRDKYDPNPWFCTVTYNLVYQSGDVNSECPLIDYVRSGRAMAAGHRKLAPDDRAPEQVNEATAGAVTDSDLWARGRRAGAISGAAGISFDSCAEQISFNEFRAWGDLSALMSDAPRSRRGVALYAMYAADGRLKTHHRAMLKLIREQGYATVLINCTRHGAERLLAEAKEYVDAIVVHRDGPRDFGGWLGAFALFLDEMLSVDEVLFANDTLIGPIGSTGAMWDSLRKCTAPVWALTDSIEGPLRHIQTSLFVLRRAVLTSDAFLQFVATYRFPHDRWDVVVQGEQALSRCLKGAGFSIEVMAKVEDVARTWLSNLPQRIASLVKACGGPIVHAAIPAFAHGTFQEYILNWLTDTRDKLHRGTAVNPQQALWDTLYSHYGYPFVKRDLLTVNPQKVTSLLALPDTIDRAHQSVAISMFRDVVVESPDPYVPSALRITTQMLETWNDNRGAS